MYADEFLESATGEHISNEKNELQYIPFPICNETGKPLELAYGVEEGIWPFNAISRTKNNGLFHGQQISTARYPS